MMHAFTVDLEDWYDGIPIPSESKRVAERRLNIGTEYLLERLKAVDVKATFFVLSPIARRHPDLLREIVRAGHEIGSHGVSHDLLYEMGAQRFQDETRRSVRDLEDFTGEPVRSYRAAYFSITERSKWAFDILTAEGIRFDSSIFPVKNWRYGLPGYSRHPTVEYTANGPLLEFPISTRRVLGKNIPTSGGAYFRLYPYAVTQSNIRAEAAKGCPTVFFIHPWELDPNHPVVTFDPRAWVTHYARLRSTRNKLDQLLSVFRFTTLSEALNDAFPGLGS
jgi:polysaccharide deacetylase family protein (PEP-CTERM system associated)